jgi:hypothetical protein
MMTIGRINKFIGQGAGDTLVLISGRKKLDKAASLLRQANLACCSMVYIGMQKPDELAALAVMPAEDFMAKEDYQRVDAFVCGRLVNGWYAYQGITDYRGLALGKMLEYEFQGFLVSRIKALELLRKIRARIKVDRIVVIEESEEAGAAALAYGKALGIPVLRVCLGRNRGIPVAIKEALGSLLSDLCDGLARRRLSAADKPAAGRIILDARLDKFFKGRAEERIFLPSLFERGLKARLRLLGAGGVYLPFYARGHWRYRREWLPYRRKWRALSADTHPGIIFTYEGIPFWGMVEKKMRSFFFVNIPRIISNMQMLDNLAADKQIKLAVLRNDAKETERALIFSLRKGGVPSLVMQHGVFAGSSHGVMLADVFAAWGEASVEWYRKFGDFADRCRITGNPRFDSLLNWQPKISKAALCAQLCLDEKKGIVLLVTQQIHKLSAFLSDDLCLVMADRVLAAMKEFPDKQLIIKADPYEDLSFYSKKIKEISPLQAAAVKDTDIYTLIFYSDLVITFNSTAGLEALFFGKPLITVNLTKGQDTVAYAGDGAALAVYRAEELTTAMHKIFSQDSLVSRLKSAGDKFIQRYAYKTDGKAGERVTALIKEYSRN